MENTYDFDFMTDEFNLYKENTIEFENILDNIEQKEKPINKQDKPYYCRLCGCGCSRPWVLKRHMYLKHNDQIPQMVDSDFFTHKFVCKQCELNGQIKFFSSNDALKRHNQYYNHNKKITVIKAIIVHPEIIQAIDKTNYN